MQTKEPEIIGLLDQKVQLAQIPGGFYSSMDSVMLAAACPAKDNQTILDLGCGVGGAGLCALYRLPKAALTGLDIQEDHIQMAQDNASKNKMDNRAKFVTQDVRAFEPQQRFDHIICNPPYLEEGTHLKSPTQSKAIAMGGEDVTLQDWITAAFNALKSRGSLTMIHQAGQTDAMIQALGKRFGATEIIPLWPRIGTPAKRVIIRTIKDRRSPAIMHPGFPLHEENGEYTKEAQNILRKAHPIL